MRGVSVLTAQIMRINDAHDQKGVSVLGIGLDENQQLSMVLTFCSSFLFNFHQILQHHNIVLHLFYA
jgi:hypothetical protein